MNVKDNIGFPPHLSQSMTPDKPTIWTSSVLVLPSDVDPNGQ